MDSEQQINPTKSLIRSALTILERGQDKASLVRAYWLLIKAINHLAVLQRIK